MSNGMKDRISIALQWAQRSGHNDWCDISRMESFPGIEPTCTCGREGAIATLERLYGMADCHVVILSEKGWVIEHPLDCRLAGQMDTCFATRAMIEHGESLIPGGSNPHGLGRYVITENGGTFLLEPESGG